MGVVFQSLSIELTMREATRMPVAGQTMSLTQAGSRGH